MLKILCYLVLIVFPIVQCYAQSSYIYVVGSSTVFPLISLGAEEFGRKNRTRIPVVESTGTGNGFKLFCAGNDKNTPDIVTASRRMNAVEAMLCEKNKVSDILKVTIGYDGIVFANSIDTPILDFSESDLFSALSSHVADGNFTIKKNPNLKWSSINNSFPDRKIEIYGPSRETGTYDSIINTIFLHSCMRLKAFNIQYGNNPEEFKKACSIIRDDGSFIEMGNDENLIVQKIIRNPYIFGIFGYNFLDKNKISIHGNKINGVAPTYENIASGKYILSRPLYLYIKTQHINEVTNLDKFIQEITGEIAIGPKGYLIDQGLIPLSEQDMQILQKQVQTVLQ